MHQLSRATDIVVQLHDLCARKAVFGLLHQGGRGGVGHVAWMGRREIPAEFWWVNLKARGHFKDPGADGRILLKFILNRLVDRVLD